MKRKMIGAAVSYMSGLFFASFFHDIRCLIILSLLGTAVLIHAKAHKWKLSDFLLIVLIFSFGIGAETLYTLLKYKPAIALDGHTGSFSGEVTEISRYDGDMAGYTINGIANEKTSLKLTYYGADINAEYGDIISFENCTFSRLKRDYLFDSEKYYKSDGVFLSAENVNGISVIHKNSRRLKNFMAAFRENMTFRFMTETEPDVGAFLAGMIFGEKRGLDDNIKTSLYRSGIGHILAVSGLHVSIIAALLMTVLNVLKIDRRISFVVMDIVLAGFVLMANSPVSAVRAAVMMNFFYAAGLFRRQNDSLNSLSAAALLISIANPYCIFDEGFLLSLAGTFGIAVFAPLMAGRENSDKLSDILKRDMLIGLCTAAAVFPVSMLFFDETSVISPITNILLVPVCTAAMVIGLIFMLTGGLLPVLNIAEVFIKIVILISNKLANISFFHISHGSDAAAEFLIFLGFACISVYIVSHSRRFTAFAIVFSFAIYSGVSAFYSNRRNSEFTVAVLGRGTDAAVAVTYNGSTDIIDLTGSHRNAAYISRYMTVNGIDKADTLVLTNSPQTQYASYANEFEFVDVGEWLALSDTEIFGSEIERYFDNSGFVIEHKDYTVDYADKMLKIQFGNEVIMFAPCGEEAGSSGISVCYGGTPKDDRYTDIIYLCDSNNFEIILSGDSRYRREL